jgi:hypothetical protein
VTTTQVLLILFDGAEWNVIQPLLQAGRLPNLAAFMQAGSYGRLRSLDDVALASPILWTSFATGKLPHKHGVKDFYDTASSVQCSRLWEIFEAEGLPIGLFRYLITWPSRPTNGFIVPDWCARTPEAFPAELSFINAMPQAKGWLDLARHGVQALRHGVRPPSTFLAVKELLREALLKPARLDKRFRQRLVELAIHTDLFCRLLRRHHPYFSIFYTGLPDAIHHEYWKFMEPEKFQRVRSEEVERYGWVIPRVYEELDGTLGRMLRQATSQTLVVIASDHGGEANVLEEYRWGEIRGEEFIKALGLNGTVSAFRIGPKTYFRLRTVSGPLKSIRTLAERLRQVRLVGSSTPIFLVEVSGEDQMTVQVDYLKESVDGAQLRFPDGAQFPIEQLLNLSPTISGNHSMHGILLMRGPHVRQNYELTGASLLDVTPTILALLGRPVGRDMDGRVLTDAIDPNYLRLRPIRFIESYDVLLGKRPTPPVEDPDLGLEAVKERLRDLGYLE